MGIVFGYSYQTQCQFVIDDICSAQDVIDDHVSDMKCDLRSLKRTLPLVQRKEEQIRTGKQIYALCQAIDQMCEQRAKLEDFRLRVIKIKCGTENLSALRDISGLMENICTQFSETRMEDTLSKIERAECHSQELLPEEFGLTDSEAQSYFAEHRVSAMPHAPSRPLYRKTSLQNVAST